MALILSIASGNFNSSLTWAGGVVPGLADEARANGHTVTITADVSCSEISNAGTGTFILNDGVTLTANVTHKSTTVSINCLSFSSASPATATIIGNVSGGSTANPSYAVTNTSSGTLRITGVITGGSGGNCFAVHNLSSGTVIITGNCIASSGNEGYPVWNRSNGLIQVTGNVVGGSNNSGVSSPIAISNAGIGIINVTGNVIGGSSSQSGAITNASSGSILVTGQVFASNTAGITNNSTGPVTIYGNLNGALVAGLSNTSTGSITIVGNVIGNSRGGAGIASSNALANVKISGNLISAPNGIPAVYAASYTVNPVPYQTYIRYANNGTGVGSDAYLYHYTTDSLSAFSMPPLSAVRAGLQYANNTLTGTCEIPAASAVTFGALVDNTSGTAVITNNTLFDVSIASLTAIDSLGARLKNSATVESVGRIIASFSN